MVARVLLDVTGLRVSNPGLDVNTTSIAQNLFDSRRGKYFGVFLSGVLGPGAFSAVGSPTISTFVATTTFQAVVYYGRTYASPPVVMAVFRSPQDANTGMSVFWDNNVNLNGTVSGPGGTFGTGGMSRTIFRPFTDRVVFETTYWDYTFRQPGPSAISYIVGNY